MSSTGTNSASSSNVPSPGGVNFHHLSRNQLEKIINLRINSQTCHDIKCKREREYFQRVISKMADTFSELFAQIEKQRKDLQEVTCLHNKLCTEFAIPNKITNRNEDYQKLKSIATMFQEFFAKHAKNAGVKIEIGASSNATAKQIPPIMRMAAGPEMISAGSNNATNMELARKRKLAGTVSTNAVTIKSTFPNKSATGGQHSSITPSSTPMRTSTPSTSNFAQPKIHYSPVKAANNVVGNGISKLQMLGMVANQCFQNEQNPNGRAKTTNNFASPQKPGFNVHTNMATPPTVSAIIYQGQELSFGSSNSASKKPRFATPMPKITSSSTKDNEADIIQID